MPRKSPPKTRNAGTMTEPAFWAAIRSMMRRKTMWWKPIRIAKERVRRNYTGPNKKLKYEYQCSNCKGWFPDKEIHVDHIVPAGTLTCAEDMPAFVERLFCEVQGYQVLCIPCHHTKTQNERKCRKKKQ